ncbi:MAG: cysteine synthase family protein [Acidobacteriota bacterium]|nr:cysteine synthase family protein [Acidobacteriota bacterium]
MVYKSVIEMIGNTPLLDISEHLEEECARLVVKLEMFNPGGSIKDRPALAMIEAAERAGNLKPGMTIVEPTAGNTGIGLALVGNLKGYRTVFFVPDRMSREKILAMRLYGAEVHLVPKELGMAQCIELARSYCEEHGNCFMTQQFENPANPNQAESHLGPEVYEQLGRYPDGMTVGAGTGGTFTGLARWLKKNNPNGICWLVEPKGSIFGGGPRGSYLVEGIGNSFYPQVLDMDLADHVATIADTDSFAACKFIAHKMGLIVGGSAGANFHAAKQLCRQLGPGKTVLTVFPDNMERYYSKDWVAELVED